MSREARVHSCSVSYGIPLYACTQRVRTLLSVGVWLLYSWGLYILAHVAWRTWTEVSAEWLPGSRTAVSECVRVSRFNAECQGVVQSDHSGVEGSVPCSRPPQGAV